MADSIARTFAKWSANLKYEDLPPEVVDKVRSLILTHLVSAVFGAQMKAAQETIHMVKQEEGKPDGATILVDGSKATRIGATYANSEMIHLPGLWDQYRMITHPGVSLIPSGIVNAELERKQQALAAADLTAEGSFGDVLMRENRYDLLLDMDPPVQIVSDCL